MSPLNGVWHLDQFPEPNPLPSPNPSILSSVLCYYSPPLFSFHFQPHLPLLDKLDWRCQQATHEIYREKVWMEIEERDKFNQAQKVLFPVSMYVRFSFPWIRHGGLVVLASSKLFLRFFRLPELASRCNFLDRRRRQWSLQTSMANQLYHRLLFSFMVIVKITEFPPHSLPLTFSPNPPLYFPTSDKTIDLVFDQYNGNTLFFLSSLSQLLRERPKSSILPPKKSLTSSWLKIGLWVSISCSGYLSLEKITVPIPPFPLFSLPTTRKPIYLWELLVKILRSKVAESSLSQKNKIRKTSVQVWLKMWFFLSIQFYLIYIRAPRLTQWISSPFSSPHLLIPMWYLQTPFTSISFPSCSSFLPFHIEERLSIPNFIPKSHPIRPQQQQQQHQRESMQQSPTAVIPILFDLSRAEAANLSELKASHQKNPLLILIAILRMQRQDCCAVGWIANRERERVSFCSRISIAFPPEGLGLRRRRTTWVQQHQRGELALLLFLLQCKGAFGIWNDGDDDNARWKRKRLGGGVGASTQSYSERSPPPPPFMPMHFSFECFPNDLTFLPPPLLQNCPSRSPLRNQRHGCITKTTCSS